MTKPIYQMYAYFCLGCGRYAWEARIPEGKEPKDAQPVKCGRCSGSRFEARKVA
jgi:DNA-directed RNA polymerase subunit RPC12/RpoP